VKAETDRFIFPTKQILEKPLSFARGFFVCSEFERSELWVNFAAFFRFLVQSFRFWLKAKKGGGLFLLSPLDTVKMVTLTITIGTDRA